MKRYFIVPLIGLLSLSTVIAKPRPELAKNYLIFEGDSLTQELGTGTDIPRHEFYYTYPSVLRTLWWGTFNAWTNFAVGGNNISDVNSRQSKVINSFPRNSNRLLILWVGANDMPELAINWYGHDPEPDPVQWCNTFNNYCYNIHRAGIKICVLTVQDRCGASFIYPSIMSFRNTVNETIKNCPYVDYVIDIASLQPDMLPQDNPNTFDGTHASLRGAVWQARLIDASIHSVFEKFTVDNSTSIR